MVWLEKKIKRGLRLSYVTILPSRWESVWQHQRRDAGAYLPSVTTNSFLFPFPFFFSFNFFFRFWSTKLFVPCFLLSFWVLPVLPWPSPTIPDLLIGIKQ